MFVGDEGTTEPRGPSHRHAWEIAARVRPFDWLSLGGDVTISRARFDNGDAVPLAPRLTARGDVAVRFPWGLSTSIGVRYLADRYATEDRQHTARGYTLVDFTARYRFKMVEAFLSTEYLADVEYREAQFFFTSRLRGEPAEGVDDIHFNPAARPLLPRRPRRPLLSRLVKARRLQPALGVRPGNRGKRWQGGQRK